MFSTLRVEQRRRISPGSAALPSCLSLDGSLSYLLTGHAVLGTISLHDMRFPLNGIPPLSNNDGPVAVHPLVTSVTTSGENGAAKYGGACSIEWIPNDLSGFLCARRKALVLYDTNSFKPAATFPCESMLGCAVPKAGTSHMMIACAAGGHVRLCDLRAGSFVHTLAGHAGKSSVLCVDWCPSEEWVLVSGGTDATVRLWDARKSASCLHSFDQTQVHSQPNERRFRNTGVGLSALVALAGDKETQSSSLIRKETIYSTAHAGPVFSVRFAPDGQSLASRDRDAIRVWCTASGRNTMVNLDHLGAGHPPTRAMAFSHDGHSLMVGCGNDVVVVSARSGVKENALKAHFGQISDLSVVSERLWSCGEDRQILEWTPRAFDHSQAQTTIADLIQDDWMD
jgi:DNA excision repair protein ERCC-8